jgi:hypothetical protein
VTSLSRSVLQKETWAIKKYICLRHDEKNREKRRDPGASLLLVYK